MIGSTWYFSAWWLRSHQRVGYNLFVSASVELKSVNLSQSNFCISISCAARTRTLQGGCAYVYIDLQKAKILLVSMGTVCASFLLRQDSVAYIHKFVRVQRNNSNVTKCAQNIKQQALETSVLLPCKRALLHPSPKSSHFFSFLQTNYRQLRLSRRHFKKRTRYQPPTIAWYSGGKAQWTRSKNLGCRNIKLQFIFVFNYKQLGEAYLNIQYIQYYLLQRYILEYRFLYTNK